MDNSFDAVLLCFSNPIVDARTINLAKTLIKYDRKIALITPDFGDEPDYIEGDNKYIPLNINLDRQLRYQIKEFSDKVNKLDISARNINAGDLYSLHAAKSLKMKKGGKLIYDSREIYSRLTSTTDRPFVRKIMETMEKYLVTFVDEMVVSAENDAVYLKKHFMHSKEYTIIKNLPPQVQLEKSNILKEKFNINKETTLLLYQGWILEGRGLIPLIKSIEKVDDVELVIIGEGEFEDNVKDEVKKRNLNDRIHFTGVIPYQDLFKYTLSADAGVALFEPISISYEYSLPNKLFEYIQCGLPVITTNLDAIADVVSLEDVGILVKDVEEDEIKSALEEIKDKELRKKYSENSINCREKYSYDTQELKILKVFA